MPKKKVSIEKPIVNLELYEKVTRLASKNNRSIVLVREYDDCLIFQDTETEFLFFASTSKEIVKTHSVAIVFKIANKIANLPSANLIKNLEETSSLTDDLKTEWLLQTEESGTISKLFLTLCLELNIDLIKGERKLLHKKAIEACELLAYVYRALWDLVKLTFSIIKKANKTLDFSTADDLFTDIVKAHRNSTFTQISDSLYIEFLPRIPTKNLRYFEHEWLSHVLCVTEVLSTNSQKARHLKFVYENAIEALDQAIDELASVRTKKGFLIKNEVWKDKKCFLLDRYKRLSIQRAVLKVK